MLYVLLLACGPIPGSDPNPNTPEQQTDDSALPQTGETPRGFDQPWGCIDEDHDGWGVPPCGFESWYRPVEGVGDCDDLDREIYPGQEEVCDALDNDCDDEIDEEVGTWAYLDQDGDGCPDEGAKGQWRCPEGMSGFSTGC